MTETLIEDHKEIAFEFDFPIEESYFYTKFDRFGYINNDHYGYLDIRTEDYIGYAFGLILLFFGLNITLPFKTANEQNLWIIAIFLIFVTVIAFKPFLRFIPIQTTRNSNVLIRSKFDIHKLSSVWRQNNYIFKDFNQKNEYSLYFSHNRGHLKLNKSKIALDIKKYDGSTLELINKDYDLKFTIKINKKKLSNNKKGNFVITTFNKVDKSLVLFISFVLYRTGQLNSLVEVLKSTGIKPTKIKVILGLITVVLNSLVLPALIVYFALTFLPSLLHSNSQWDTLFMIFDLLLFFILWFSLIDFLLVAPIKHFRKNIWDEGDNIKYFISELFTSVLFFFLLTFLIMYVIYG